MRDLKKILKLRASNKSQRFIADSLKISRNTISRIFSLADQKKLCTDADLYGIIKSKSTLSEYYL